MDFQIIIVALIIGCAVIYAASRVRRSLRHDSPCCGCNGCELCEEMKKKGCNMKKEECKKKKDCQKFGQSK